MGHYYIPMVFIRETGTFDVCASWGMQVHLLTEQLYGKAHTLSPIRKNDRAGGG